MRFWLLAALMALIISVCALAAEVNLLESYGPGEILSGTISLDLKNESADSNVIAVFGSISRTTKLIDFLTNSNADYSCIPEDCSEVYSASSPSLTKKVNNDYIALYIPSGTIKGISQISFNMTGTAATQSCGGIPVKLDVLDDGTIDWQYMEASDTPCETLSANPAYDEDAAEADYNIVTDPYCEKISMVPAKRFKLGADIEYGSVPTKVAIFISDGIERGECELPAISGLQTCLANFTAPEEKDYYVCVYSDNEDSDARLKGETKKPNCGQFGFTEFECNDSSIDYAIYGQPTFFKPFLETTVFDGVAFSEFSSEELESYVQDYLNSKYNSNCSSGCVIPLKIISNQEVTFSGLNFNYLTNLGSKTDKNFYSVGKKAAKVSMPLQELSLDAAGFRLPSSYGNYTASIYLNSKLLAKKTIAIEKVPIIKSLTPSVVPAATATSFVSVVESPKGNAIVSYYWDFGDGVQETTNLPSVSHVYGMGNYSLTLKATDSEGLISQRTFQIKAEEPKNIVNLTIAQKKENFEKLKTEIKKIPLWYASLVDINLNEIEAKLAEFEADFKKSGADYVSLKLSLDDLFVPSKILEDRFETPMHSEPIVSYIATLDSSEVSNEEETKAGIKAWNDANVDITAFYTVQTAFEDEKSESLATAYKLEIKSSGDVSFNSVYLVISSPAEMIFKSNYSEYSKQKVDSATAFIIDLNNEIKTIEFAVPGNHSADEFTIFASPGLEKLEFEGTVCGDGICDAANGESYANCPSDCKKPYGRAVIWVVIIIILVAAGLFGIWKYYAVMYDRRLRKKLFVNNEDFYKISFFIASEMNKQSTEKEIREKLEKAEWKNSQIEYAMKKVTAQTRAIQKKSILAYVERELTRMTEEEIRKKLEEGGWKIQLINWAIRKAKKEQK